MPSQDVAARQRRSDSGEYNHRKGGEGCRDGHSCLAPAARGDAGTRREQPHASRRERREQTHAPRRAGVGRHVRGVPDRNATADEQGNAGPGRRHDERGKDRCGSARESRVGQGPMRNDPGERNERQTRRCADSADQKAPLLEPASPVDAGAELIDVGQPGAARRGHRQAGSLEGTGLYDLSSGQGQGDTHELVSCVAHAGNVAALPAGAATRRRTWGGGSQGGRTAPQRQQDS